MCRQGEKKEILEMEAILGGEEVENIVKTALLNGKGEGRGGGRTGKEDQISGVTIT